MTQPATRLVVNGTEYVPRRFAATKTEADGKHPAADYAYVPDPEKPSTWKLRIDSVAQVGAAAAALGPGYRGQKVDLPDADRAAVVARVRAAWKRLNPDKDPAEMPGALKATEAGDAALRLVERLIAGETPRRMTDAGDEEDDAATAAKAIAIVNELIKDEAAEIGPGEDECSDLETLLQVRMLLFAFARGEFDEALVLQMDEPTGGDVSVPAFVGDSKPARGLNHYARKLKEILRRRGVPATVLDDAHRAARGYAGGKGRQAFEPQRFTEAGIAAVSFMEPPEWIPYLPVPHTSTHPEYGEVTLTRQRIQNMVRNFKDGFYQTELPLDSEHDLKGGGAFGFITDMRQNPDGSADARVRWTDRGTTALAGDRFTCVSPEWFDEWQDKVTGERRPDVAIGGALTNRPFFKHTTLRPLAASEHVIGAVWQPRPVQQEARQMAENTIPVPDDGATTHGDLGTGQHAHPHTGGDGEMHSEMHKHEGDGDHGHDCSDTMPFAGTERRMTAAEQKTFAEKLAAIEAENIALRQMSEASKQAAEQSRLAVERMAAEVQAKRFTDEVLGRSDQNGVRWWVPTAEGEQYSEALDRTLGTLRTLASTFGEASPEFTGYVAQQRRMAETLRTSDVFKAAGQPGMGTAASAEARVGAMARQMVEKNPNLSLAAATDAVLTQNPHLYAEAEAERERRIKRGE